VSGLWRRVYLYFSPGYFRCMHISDWVCLQFRSWGRAASGEQRCLVLLSILRVRVLLPRLGGVLPA
jgi:hypothetical protein